MGSAGLGRFEQTVILGVLRSRNLASVAEVRQEISERTGEEVSTSAVHTTIERLVTKGMLSSKDSGLSGRGVPRRLFCVTAAGESAAREAWSAMAAMAEGILT